MIQFNWIDIGVGTFLFFMGLFSLIMLVKGSVILAGITSIIMMLAGANYIRTNYKK